MSARLRLSNPLAAAAWLALFWPGRLLGDSSGALFAGFVVVSALFVIAVKDAPWESRAPSRLAAGLTGVLFLCAAGSLVFAAAFKGAEAGAARWAALLRWAGLGLFTVQLIRFFDETSRRALERGLFALPFVALVLLAAFRLDLPLLAPLARALYDDPGRLAAPFERADLLGAALAMGLFYLPTRRGELAVAAHAAASTAALALTGSLPSWAAAWLGLCAWGALAFTDSARRRRLPRPVLLGLGLFLALSTGGLFALRASRQAPVFAADASSAAVDPVRDLFWNSPLLGWGPSPRAESLARSQFSLWLLRGGAVGLLAALAALLPVAWRLRPGLAPHPGAAAALLACLAALLAGMPLLESDRLAVLSGLLAAAALRRPA